MLNEDAHISDRELLMMADGELSARRSLKIRIHLAACWNCRARMAGIEGAILDFARAYQEISNDVLPPAAGPRALLSAHLAELASTIEDRSRLWPDFFPWGMRAAVLCVALSCVTFIGKMAFHDHGVQRSDADLPSMERGMVPNGELTPGATRTATLDELCSSSHEEVVGQVNAPLRKEVLKEYGINNANAGDYEIDYLIAPRLGGTEDIRNLWPQPYKARIWNAYDKDALEERLHQLVCERRLDLVVAQGAIANDWIAAYKRYFQTKQPLPGTADLNYPETPGNLKR